MYVNKSKLFILITLWCVVHTCAASLEVRLYERQAGEGGIAIEPFHAPASVNKRNADAHYDQAAYTFNGLEKVESVPVLFPLDICLMSFNGSTYAAALHKDKAGVRHFAVFKKQGGRYTALLDVATPLAIGMDCCAYAERGFVALAYNLTAGAAAVRSAKDGAPIYRIAEDRVRAVQYFAATNVRAVYLRIAGSELMLLQSYHNAAAATNVQCPCFVWSGATFARMGVIPCSNARRLEPFAMDYESYVAVANYADQRGRTATNSAIYKFSREQRQFQLFQRIHTNGAVDVRFFSVPHDVVRRQHFLVFGNSLSDDTDDGAAGGGQEPATSIFYTYENGQFVPYQRLSLYAVQQFLPIENVDAEKFLLFVAQGNQNVKIYNLNDWKFEESATQFTDGALSRGVAHMRVYRELEDSYLVIANERMSELETNVFRPIFKREEHANTLRRQIIDWCADTVERLQQIDVVQLQRDVAAKLARIEALKPQLNLSISEIETANIQTVITKSLTYTPLNLNAQYWQALSYAKQALDALDTAFPSPPPPPPTAQRTRRDADDETVAEKNVDVEEDDVLEVESLTVDTLIVHGKLQARIVNGVDVARPQFSSIEAHEVVVSGTYNNTVKTVTSAPIDKLEQLNVRKLQITGKLNDLTFDELVNKTLKHDAAHQTFEAPVSLVQLQADAVNVRDNKLNGQTLAGLVRIDTGEYTVHQNVQFTAPIRVERLWVHERLNNLQVRGNKFDALLRRSNETQIVVGSKRFQSLRLRQPLQMGGEMLGQYLRNIAPIQTVHKPLVLQGDYVIDGDVEVAEMLKIADLIDSATNATISRVLENALRWDEPLDNVHLQFTQPLSVNESQVSYVNQHDLQHLVRLNWSMPQVITGKKTFANTLTVREGFCEVRYLNGVDVETLEHVLLLQHTNQTIHVPMHVGRIVAKSIQAERLTLNGTDLSQFLTWSTNQTVTGPLKVHTLSTNTLNVQHLNTNDQIFGQTLNAIYEQKSRNAPHPNFFRRNRKFHGTLHVKNLFTSAARNATINSRPVAFIERQLSKLRGDIKYIGNFKFKYDMNITNLTFTGRLNGIPAHEFGRCWLTRHGEQDFVAPQTIAAVHVLAPEGLQLHDKLNGVDVEDFYDKAVWINRDEYIPNVRFANPIQMLGTLTAPTINGLRVPDDMLHATSAVTQTLDGPVVVKGDLVFEEHGGLWNVTTLNGIDLNALENFLNRSVYDTLHVEHAHFDEAPNIQTLNKYNLTETLDEIWLLNESVDLRQQNVEIAAAQFEGLLEVEGPVNNVDLTYLKQNYFSLSRPQDVDVDIIIEGDVEYAGDFGVEHLYLTGPIMESTSGRTFEFEDFVYHTLKKSGPHTVSAAWHVDEARLDGDLHGASINGLDLSRDVLLNNAQHPAALAHKYIDSAEIDHLYAPDTARVNKVNVARWVRDAVYRDRPKQIIRGTTILHSAEFTGNLRVDGRVNNITFDEHNLLLADGEQDIRGEVRIRSKFPQQTPQTLTTNFNHLRTELVNGWNLTEFYENKANMSPTLDIHGHLYFQQPFVAHEVYNLAAIDDAEYKWKRSDNTDERNLILENAITTLNCSISTSFYYVDHFELLQKLPIGNATQLLHFHLHLNGKLNDLIGVHHGADDYTFYAWNSSERHFETDTELKSLLQGRLLPQLLHTLSTTNGTIVLDENTIAMLKSFQQQNDITNESEIIIEPMKEQGENCFALNAAAANAVRVFCYTRGTKDEMLQTKLTTTIARADVRQMHAFMHNQRLALRLVDGVEIWNKSGHFLQHLPLTHTRDMQSVLWHNVAYLAMVTKTGTVDIYRSEQADNFTHMQTLNRAESIGIAFSPLPEADDLLLHVLTADMEQSVSVYQYQGVLGFQPVELAVPYAAADNRVQLQYIALQNAGQHLLAVMDAKGMHLVDIVLREY